MTLPHCSSVISVTAAVPPRPALLTITSRPPSSSAASISACTCASSVTSHTSERTRSAPNSSAQRLLGLGEPALVGVAEYDGLGALLEHPRATAAPMPAPAAAVTTTTLSRSRPCAGT